MPITRLCLAIALTITSMAVSASPWTFRGNLNDGGVPANGRYDLRVSLLGEGQSAAVLRSVTLYQVVVTDGQFAVDVDFGIDLAAAPVTRLRTEVQQGGSGFVALGEPTHFDAKAALGSVCWDTSGNTGTNPIVDFLGTADALPLVLRTGNVQSLRIEPSLILSNGSPITANIIAGSSANNVTAGVRGATVAGGGALIGNSDPEIFREGPNRVTDVFGSVGGGNNNQAGNADGSVVNSPFATVGGGDSNRAAGNSSTVGGGQLNVVEGSTSTIAGGANNLASGRSSSIIGGASNDASANLSTIGGGFANIASGEQSTIAGGNSNVVSGPLSTVGGGRINLASGEESTVSGGLSNRATGERSTVVGGAFNNATGSQSTVSGGQSNCAGGDFSWAGGGSARVRPGNEPSDDTCFEESSGDADGDEGTFLWGGRNVSNIPFRSTGPNQFGVRARGVYFGAFNVNAVSLPAGRFINTASGAHLTTGGTWTNASSRSLKTAFEAVDSLAVLKKVASLPLSTWAYKDSVEGRHLGPVAEDFKALFDLGGDGESIATVDADGVALAAIQGLNQKLEAENAALRFELADHDRALEAQQAHSATIEARLRALEAQR